MSSSRTCDSLDAPWSSDIVVTKPTVIPAKQLDKMGLESVEMRQKRESRLLQVVSLILA